MNPAVSLGLGIVDKGAQIAIEILRKKNTVENRKYIDEYMDAKKHLLAEKSKLNAEQLDNVVEHYEAKLEILYNVAQQEQASQGGA